MSERTLRSTVASSIRAAPPPSHHEEIDRYGLDLFNSTPRGYSFGRVPFAATITEPLDLRAAAVELVRRARGA